MTLTPRMREALTKALRQDGLRRVHDGHEGQPPWPAHPNTITALERHQLVTRERVRNRKGHDTDLWRISQAGRDALDPPPRTIRDTVRSLRAKGAAVTRIMQGGVWTIVTMPEPEPVHPDDLRREWGRDSDRRHAEAETPRQLAARLVGELRRAA